MINGSKSETPFKFLAVADADKRTLEMSTWRLIFYLFLTAHQPLQGHLVGGGNISQHVNVSCPLTLNSALKRARMISINEI